MSNDKDKEQRIEPASLSIRASAGAPTITKRPEEPLFRKGVYLALQQLGNAERGQAMGLLPADLKAVSYTHLTLPTSDLV